MKLNELIKLIWQYLKPYKKMVYFCIFLATFASVVSAVIPLVYGRLVDEAVKEDVNLKLIGLILLAWLVFVTIANWMSRFVNLKGQFLGMKGYQSFVADIFSHLIQLPLNFHRSKKTGEELNKIDRAGDTIWILITDITFSLAPGFLTAAAAIVLMFLTEWSLTLVIFVILTFYTWATIFKTKPIIKEQKTIEKYWRRTWGVIYDSVGNIDVVKSHTKEQEESSSVYRHIEDIVNKMMKFFIAWRNLSAWQNNIQGIGFVIVFGTALYLLVEKEITAGVLVTFVGYVNLVFRPFNQLAHNYQQIQKGLVTTGQAMKLYGIQKELYDKGEKLKVVQGKVEFKNVTFAYDKKHHKVLREISFEAKAGEVVALVGESGTGKTTLLSLISRYWIPEKGRVLLDNIDLEKINLTFLREQISIVPQEISLFNDTLKKNLIYAKKNARDEEIINALKAANAWEFVQGFPKRLNQVVGERGIKLSTGQKQRIAIARAILRDPKILILDEATSALDSVSEKLVQEALKNLIKGRTTFIIAHRLSTITHADKILVFDKGRLVEQGKHDELVRLQGVYAKLYQKQKF